MGAVNIDPARFERLLNPRSIAVFGGAQAQEVIRQCDLMGYDGEIWPVHPKKDEIRGARSTARSTSCRAAPTPPTSGSTATSPSTSSAVSRHWTRAAPISYATGFAEAGEEGSELTRQLLEASGDMVLVGPNCYGLLNYVSGRDAVAGPAGRPPGGRAASPSSRCRPTWASTSPCSGAACPSPTWSRWATASSSTCNDAIKIFAQQERVTAIGLYLETMPDPKTLPGGRRRRPRAGQADRRDQDRAARRSRRRSSMSHTASLAGSDVLVERAVRASRRGARRLAGGAGRGAQAAARRWVRSRAAASPP